MFHDDHKAGARAIMAALGRNYYDATVEAKAGGYLLSCAVASLIRLGGAGGK